MNAVDLQKIIRGLDIEAICIETVTDNKEAMVDFNADQLSRGVRQDDTEIAPPYTAFTVFEKSGKSGLASVTDVVTLFDTGAHYAGLFAEVDGRNIVFGSTDKKSPGLQEKYGKIYGLNSESKEGLVEEFLAPDFQRKIHNITGLMFNDK